MLKDELSVFHIRCALARRVKFRAKWVKAKLFKTYYSVAKVRPKQIVFEAYLGKSYACSPRAIYEYMKRVPEYDDFKFVWVFEQPERYDYLKGKRTRIVKYRSLKYYMIFAQSKYWIVNGWISTKIQKKAGQVMLQCWHGTPLKRLRVDIIKNTKHATLSYNRVVAENRKDTARYDYFISPSRFCTKAFTSAFDLKSLGKQEIVIETGYPRNDFLYNFTANDTRRIKRKLGLPNDKKVILYAPTWRDDQYEKDKGFTYDIGLDFSALKQQLGEDYILLFRAHYNITSQFDFSKHKSFIYDVSAVDDVNELYVISDMLITDYSSVFFDYANLERPIIFYMYDLESYEKELRGFYIDLKELPGPIVKTQGSLLEAVQNVSTLSAEYQKKYTEFSKKYNYLDDGSASKRVVENII